MKTRGYCAIYLPWEGFSYPNNASPAPGEPELSFDELCSRLATAGVNLLRIKFCGWNGPLGTGAQSFEPRYGVFNNWGGRLPELVEACRKHGVLIQAIPFDNVEWQGGWAAHGWNTARGGFLDDPRNVFDDPTAIQAAKARIDAIVARCGDVIGAWEICAEMTWLMSQAFWDVTWAELEQITDNIVVPWVEEMTQHIKSKHSAPVGNGIIAGDPTAPRNRIHMTPSLDFALINWYGSENLGAQMRWLRECQIASGKPVYVEQYAPWNVGATTSPEPADFALSKATEWAATCGEYGCVGPLRWPEIQPKSSFASWWGVAHPNMAEMARVTKPLADVINLDDWNDRGESWDAKTASVGLSLRATWGDGKHVTSFLRWSTQPPHSVQFSELEDGEYDVWVFDWLAGEELAKTTAMAENGVLALSPVLVRDNATALYLSKAGQPPILENQAPEVDAGPDQTVTLPTWVQLAGTAQDDGLPDPPGELMTLWTKESGAVGLIFENATLPDTMVAVRSPGTYTLRLTAWDGELETYDEMTLTVLDEPVEPSLTTVRAMVHLMDENGDVMGTYAGELEKIE